MESHSPLPDITEAPPPWICRERGEIISRIPYLPYPLYDYLGEFDESRRARVTLLRWPIITGHEAIIVPPKGVEMNHGVGLTREVQSLLEAVRDRTNGILLVSLVIDGTQIGIRKVLQEIGYEMIGFRPTPLLVHRPSQPENISDWEIRWALWWHS